MEKMSWKKPVDGTVNLSELLSSLPKVERWKSSNTDLYPYQGFWYPYIMFNNMLSLQQHFQALPNDVIIAGAPKTGNTWLKALCFAISTRTTQKNSDPTTRSLLSENLPHDLIPILEFGDPQNPNSCTTNPRLLSTHLPHAALPRSILSSSGCKIIYMCREPKDTFVSLWHYQRHIARVETLDMDPEFDRFCEGKIAWGPYLDHVLGYHEASLECPDRFLFLKYEDMKRDIVDCVKRVAAFMDKAFTAEEEAEGLVEEIVKMCSFEELSELEVNKTGKINFIGSFVMENSAHFRKGTVGDWRNYLTPEMAERLDRIVEERLNGSGFRFGIE